MSKIKITDEAVREIYKLAVRVYEKQLSKEDASEIAFKEKWMSKNSAKIYIDVFSNLVSGKTYKKTINLYATEYFLKLICSDYGLAIFKKALVAVKEHLDYYKRQGKGSQSSIERLIHKLENNHALESVTYSDEIRMADEFIEGATVQVTVNAYERNKKARDKAIAIHGLNCKVCDLNFEQVYGVLGKDFIHVHHVVDLAIISLEYKVNPETDLMPICPNCHAMLHKTKPAMTIESLKSKLNL